MGLEPLKISCTSTRCEDGLHCYRQKNSAPGQMSGPCRECGADLVSWDRVHARDLSDVDHTFAALKTELIRHELWHRELDEAAVNHARRKGRTRLREAVDQRLRSALAPAQPFRDGAQTPMKENVIYYAQHATATCCRKCAEEWHNIPQGREMTATEFSYCAELVWHYIEERLPQLTEEGEKIPARRASRAVNEVTRPPERDGLTPARATMWTEEQRRSSDGAPPPEMDALARARAAMRAKEQRRSSDADD
jgi:Domain of unknown function (DUF4186)